MAELCRIWIVHAVLINLLLFWFWVVGRSGIKFRKKSLIELGCINLLACNAPVSVNHMPPPQLPQGILMEKRFLSESPYCYYLPLSESHPKISIFLPFVMSKKCQNDIGKNCCCQSPLYGQTEFYHILRGGFTLTGTYY